MISLVESLRAGDGSFKFLPSTPSYSSDFLFCQLFTQSSCISVIDLTIFLFYFIIHLLYYFLVFIDYFFDVSFSCLVTSLFTVFAAISESSAFSVILRCENGGISRILHRPTVFCQSEFDSAKHFPHVNAISSQWNSPSPASSASMP